MPDDQGTIAYVLKGYPRMSETFIAAEIYRLEQCGVRLRLFATKQDEEYRHPVVDRIQAPLIYLPRTTSLSHSAPLAPWLIANVPKFGGAIVHCARAWPVGLLRALALALGQSLRTRRSWRSRPRGVYLKELLQAIAVADLVLEAGDVRHLHAHFAHGATTVAWLASTITGLPFSFTAHATDIYRESVNPAGLLRRKLAAACFVVTCTEANRAYLAQRAGTTPVHRIYHGLNVDFLELLASAPERRKRAGSSCLRILSVGRLVPKKGFLTLVEACGILARRGLRFETLIVGEMGETEDGGAARDGAALLPGSPAAKRHYATEVRRRIAELRLEDTIRLTGPMSQTALFQEYQSATLFCLPCQVLEDGDRDGIPNVLAEAMACGLPVVTTPVSGIPELVEDGINGLLVPPAQPAALAEAICELNDVPDLAEHLGRCAQETIRERFDADEGAERLASLFRKEALA